MYYIWCWSLTQTCNVVMIGWFVTTQDRDSDKTMTAAWVVLIGNVVFLIFLACKILFGISTMFRVVVKRVEAVEKVIFRRVSRLANMLETTSAPVPEEIRKHPSVRRMSASFIGGAFEDGMGMASAGNKVLPDENKLKWVFAILEDCSEKESKDLPGPQLVDAIGGMLDGSIEQRCVVLLPAGDESVVPIGFFSENDKALATPILTTELTGCRRFNLTSLKFSYDEAQMEVGRKKMPSVSRLQVAADSAPAQVNGLAVAAVLSSSHRECGQPLSNSM